MLGQIGKNRAKSKVRLISPGGAWLLSNTVSLEKGFSLAVYGSYYPITALPGLSADRCAAPQYYGLPKVLGEKMCVRRGQSNKRPACRSRVCGSRGIYTEEHRAILIERRKNLPSTAAVRCGAISTCTMPRAPAVWSGTRREFYWPPGFRALRTGSDHGYVELAAKYLPEAQSGRKAEKPVERATIPRRRKRCWAFALSSCCKLSSISDFIPRLNRLRIRFMN